MLTQFRTLIKWSHHPKEICNMIDSFKPSTISFGCRLGGFLIIKNPEQLSSGLHVHYD